MRRTGFTPPTKEKLAELQQKKCERKAKSKLPKPLKTDSVASGNTLKRKRRKKTERQKVEEKLWDECKRIIRGRYRNEDGTWTCYTSGATLTNPQDTQTGHGKPKGALPTRYKYDLRNLRPQSYNANINLGGMSDIFIAKLEQEEEGLQFLMEACRKTPDGWIIKKEDTLGGKDATILLQNLLELYKSL